MTDKTKMVYNYLKDNQNRYITAKEVAEAIGLTPRQVDGIFTMAFQRKGLGRRVFAQIKNDEGIYEDVKYLVLL